MRLNLIENWVLEIIDQVKVGHPYEDSRVEVKSQWIEPQKASRRLAGHANAARGAPILWLIGIDEKKGVVGVNHKEFASWFESIQSEFDGVSPSVTDVNIRVDDQTIVALYFETDRAPYVVKNPSFGCKNGTSISHEVPWREGTRVRTAKRSDLIRILVPVLNVPEVELLGGELICRFREKHLYWNLTLNLYIVPSIADVIAIPFHRCEVSFEIENNFVQTFLDNIIIRPPYKLMAGSGSISFSSGWEPDTVTVDFSGSEVIIHGPGRINITSDVITQFNSLSFQESSSVIDCKLFPLHSDLPIHIRSVLIWREPESDEFAKWILG